MTSTSKFIGQHLFIGIEGTELNEQTCRLLNKIRPGGIVLFRRNVSTEKQLVKLCNELRKKFSFSPLLAMDQEGGRVNRLIDVVGAMPCIDQLKQSGNPETAREFGMSTGEWLSRFGIDINFAPVLDLRLTDDITDNGLQDRCWGKTANEVIQWSGAFLDGLESKGVSSCPKHFPGLGGAIVDSHEKLPQILRSREQMVGEDIQAFVPFLNRVSLLMIGHAHYPALDDRQKLAPASVSSQIIQDLLRMELGYQGLILTDDMDMGAITRYGSFEDAVVESFVAGNDVLLICHTPEKMLEAHMALTRAVEMKQVPLDRIHESQMRLEKFRWQRAALLKSMK